jgi:hypothetical protein
MKEVEREKILENEAVRRAAYQFPNEPIIQYTWQVGTKGKTKIIFREAQDVLKAERYSILKPTALIPEFSITRASETRNKEITVEEEGQEVQEEEIIFIQESEILSDSI